LRSTSSSPHCAPQLFASQLARPIRIEPDAPGGPAAPAGPRGPASPFAPGGPAGPGSPFSPCGNFPQPASPTASVTTISPRYVQGYVRRRRQRCMASPSAQLSPFDFKQELCRLLDVVGGFSCAAAVWKLCLGFVS